MMSVYYMMYLGCNSLWTTIGFNQTYSGIVNERYFYQIQLIEMLSFLFIRTRSSLKYLPKMVTLMHVIYLFYVNSYLYAAQQEAETLLASCTFLLFTVFIFRYEMRAIKNWNPFGTFTPSETNPRCAYHLVQAGQEFSIGFNILTFFTPLRFQDYFPLAA